MPKLWHRLGLKPTPVDFPQHWPSGIGKCSRLREHFLYVRRGADVTGVNADVFNTISSDLAALFGTLPRRRAVTFVFSTLRICRCFRPFKCSSPRSLTWVLCRNRNSRSASPFKCSIPSSPTLVLCKRSH